jgi:hypothetical protein
MEGAGFVIHSLLFHVGMITEGWECVIQVWTHFAFFSAHLDESPLQLAEAGRLG